VGVCDLAENCDGVGVNCPADAKSTAVCRASAGVCDLTETCDGVSNNCPPDAKSTAVCRAAAGVCDVTETCDGVGNNCPPDALASSSVVCRPAVDPQCDFAENCTGVGVNCPPDVTQPDGTACVFDASNCTDDQCQDADCVGVPDQDACLDDFVCYRSGSVNPPNVFGVQLADQFESLTMTVEKPKLLCTPADKNGEGTVNEDVHLRTRRTMPGPPFVRRNNILVRNQLGDIRVDLIKRDVLMIPSLKSSPGGAFLGPPTPGEVDHYKCYKARVTKGTPKLPLGLQVTFTDQFTSVPKILDVKKVRSLCAPVNKNGEGISEPLPHLLCYRVKAALGQPPHVPQVDLGVSNQFGDERVKTKKENQICIPSQKILP
jgi:hypothetical protein